MNRITVSSAHVELSASDVHLALSPCWRLGSTVFAQYFLLALDIRFVATRNFVGIIIANALLAMLGWSAVRGIVQAQTVRERIAYVVGGTSGAVLAVWLS